MRYHWGLGAGHIHARIPGMAEPILTGSLQQLVNDHTGDLHSIPEPASPPEDPGQLAEYESPQSLSNYTAQLPQNTAASTSKKTVPTQDHGNQNVTDPKYIHRNRNLVEDKEHPSHSLSLRGGGQKTGEHSGEIQEQEPADSIGSIHDAEGILYNAQEDRAGLNTGDEDNCGGSVNLGDELEDPDLELEHRVETDDDDDDDDDGDSEGEIGNTVCGGIFANEMELVFSYD